MGIVDAVFAGVVIAGGGAGQADAVGEGSTGSEHPGGDVEHVVASTEVSKEVAALGVGGGLGDGDAAVIRAHIADIAEMERDRNGVEGIIESGVANAVVVGVEEGQAGDAAVSFGDE